MPKAIESIFTHWEFTEEEEPVAFVFTDLQRAHLQNELAKDAEAKARLAWEPEKYNSQEEYLRACDYIRGRMEILIYLIDLSDGTKNALIEQLRQQQSNQETE